MSEETLEGYAEIIGHMAEESNADGARIAKLETDLANAHCLLQSAHATIDPEEHRELSDALSAALEPCELPQCQHHLELATELEQSEADRARLYSAAQEVADSIPASYD